MARPRSNIRQRLLRSARKAFLSRGVDGASLRSIARGASSNVGMLYYYFGSKDELFLGVVEETYTTVLRDLEIVLAPDLPPRERLARLYARLGAITAAERETLRMVLEEALRSPRRFEQLIARFQRGHVPLVLGLVRDGRLDGTFDSQRHPLLVLLSIMALGTLPQLLAPLVSARFQLPGAPRGADLSAQLVEVALRAVGGPATQTQVPRLGVG